MRLVIELFDNGDRLVDLSAGYNNSRSIRSGAPIPDERLEADPAAELTVEEAADNEAADR